MYLFQDRAANGDSSVFSIENRGSVGMDGEYTIWVYGVWDGCTVTAHYSFDGTNYSAVDTDATLTQNKAIKVSLSGKPHIKLTLADAGASTLINAEILN